MQVRAIDRLDVLCLSFLIASSDHVNTGYVSWRDTQSGSWYVETLDRILEENAATDDLVTMLMMVSFSYYTSKSSWGSVESPWPFRPF